MSTRPSSSSTSAASRSTSAIFVTSAANAEGTPAGRDVIPSAASWHASSERPDERDVRAGLGQRGRHRAAETARAARHEGNLSVEAETFENVLVRHGFSCQLSKRRRQGQGASGRDRLLPRSSIAQRRARVLVRPHHCPPGCERDRPDTTWSGRSQPATARESGGPRRRELTGTGSGRGAAVSHTGSRPARRPRRGRGRTG